MHIALQPSEVRKNITQLAEQRGTTMASLSRQIGMKPQYLSQFIQTGSPVTLPPRLRLALAMALDVDERLLGARDPWLPGQSYPRPPRDKRDT